jgi:hypothetical protein
VLTKTETTFGEKALVGDLACVEWWIDLRAGANSIADVCTDLVVTAGSLLAVPLAAGIHAEVEAKRDLGPRPDLGADEAMVLDVKVGEEQLGTEHKAVGAAASVLEERVVLVNVAGSPFAIHASAVGLGVELEDFSTCGRWREAEGGEDEPSKATHHGIVAQRDVQLV